MGFGKVSVSDEPIMFSRQITNADVQDIGQLLVSITSIQGMINNDMHKRAYLKTILPDTPLICQRDEADSIQNLAHSCSTGKLAHVTANNI